MIRIGFDLDGVLDKSALADMARALMGSGVEVHIITGVFDEAGEWQSEASKIAKLSRLNIRWRLAEPCPSYVDGWPILHILRAVDPSFGIDYRLRDLGLRKGELCERLGISVFFDDSATYCDMMPRMAGDLVVVQVR